MARGHTYNLFFLTIRAFIQSFINISWGTESADSILKSQELPGFSGRNRFQYFWSVAKPFFYIIALFHCGRSFCNIIEANSNKFPIWNRCWCFHHEGLKINIWQSLKEKEKIILIYFSAIKFSRFLVVKNLVVNPETDSLNSHTRIGIQRINMELSNS